MKIGQNLTRIFFWVKERHEKVKYCSQKKRSIFFLLFFATGCPIMRGWASEASKVKSYLVFFCNSAFSYCELYDLYSKASQIIKAKSGLQFFLLILLSKLPGKNRNKAAGNSNLKFVRMYRSYRIFALAIFSAPFSNLNSSTKYVIRVKINLDIETRVQPR